MPTPFTHLAAAQRLLTDPAVPDTQRDLLYRQRSAFLLGNVAADARAESGAAREATHFYAYGVPMTTAPWRVMLDRFPALQHAAAADQRAFLAGYVAHLSMDEVWTVDLLGPYFAQGDWGESPRQRFFYLHILLIFMDERDEQQLDGWQADTLAAAAPDGWLPFMSDTTLCDWRDLIATQLQPGGESKTLEIFGGRIGKTPQELRAVLDAPELMQRDLWTHVPPAALADIETRMYAHARAQMLTYLNGAVPPR